MSTYVLGKLVKTEVWREGKLAGKIINGEGGVYIVHTNFKRIARMISPEGKDCSINEILVIQKDVPDDEWGFMPVELFEFDEAPCNRKGEPL